MATPVVLSRHIQTLAFIGFRHTARRWSGLPVIVPSGSGTRLRGDARLQVGCDSLVALLARGPLAEPGGLAGHERPMPFKSMERASVHRGRLSVAF
jgi:hypothetical protein